MTIYGHDFVRGERPREGADRRPSRDNREITIIPPKKGLKGIARGLCLESEQRELREQREQREHSAFSRFCPLCYVLVIMQKKEKRT